MDVGVIRTTARHSKPDCALAAEECAEHRGNFLGKGQAFDMAPRTLKLLATELIDRGALRVNPIKPGQDFDNNISWVTKLDHEQAAESTNISNKMRPQGRLKDVRPDIRK